MENIELYLNNKKHLFNYIGINIDNNVKKICEDTLKLCNEMINLYDTNIEQFMKSKYYNKLCFLYTINAESSNYKSSFYNKKVLQYYKNSFDVNNKLIKCFDLIDKFENNNSIDKYTKNIGNSIKELLF